MAYNPNLPAGQAVSASSAPVVIASDQSVLPTKLTDVSAAISIAANATSSGSCTSLGGAATFCVQLTGTFTATAQLQITRDGSTYVNITGSNQIINMATGAYMASGNLTAVGMYQVDVTGAAGARVITTAYTSGTITGTAAITQTPAVINIEGTPPVVQSGTWTVGVTGYPTAAASADALANPTITQVGAPAMNYNTSTWDRVRNNVNTTTGDTGAKTATFNGATQTNFNARGAYITCLCSTVSGTTPTMNLQLQWSPDAGTTWLNYGAATTNITTTGNTASFLVYPTQFNDPKTTTIAAITIGATASKYINGVLPRTWRIVYTIGGTTPSFTITATYVNYVN